MQLGLLLSQQSQGMHAGRTAESAGLSMQPGLLLTGRGYESYKVKKQVLISATEAAEIILRVDDIIRCAPRQRQG